jgi:hypothetical protein
MLCGYLFKAYVVVRFIFYIPLLILCQINKSYIYPNIPRLKTLLINDTWIPIQRICPDKIPIIMLYYQSKDAIYIFFALLSTLSLDKGCQTFNMIFKTL